MFSATGRSCFELVVVLCFFFVLDYIPFSFINRSIRLWLICCSLECLSFKGVFVFPIFYFFYYQGILLNLYKIVLMSSNKIPFSISRFDLGLFIYA